MRMPDEIYNEWCDNGVTDKVYEWAQGAGLPCGKCEVCEEKVVGVSYEYEMISIDGVTLGADPDNMKAHFRCGKHPLMEKLG